VVGRLFVPDWPLLRMPDQEKKDAARAELVADLRQVAARLRKA
jgi:hypothetical protein